MTLDRAPRDTPPLEGHYYGARSDIWRDPVLSLAQVILTNSVMVVINISRKCPVLSTVEMPLYLKMVIFCKYENPYLSLKPGCKTQLINALKFP